MRVQFVEADGQVELDVVDAKQMVAHPLEHERSEIRGNGMGHWMRPGVR